MSGLRTLSFGAGARVFALGSQFLVMILLSRSMETTAFGDMMVVFVLYRLLGNSLGVGFGNLVTYHVGRKGGDERLNVRLLRSTSLAAGACAGLLTLAFIFWAGTISAWFGKPGMEMWLVQMAPLLLFSTLNFTAMGSLEGRSRINMAIAVNEVAPNAFLLAALSAGLLVGRLPLELIAWILWIALAVPWLFSVRTIFSRDGLGIERLSLWDLRYAGLSMLTVLAYMRLQGIDMLLVGWLFSSQTAASYAIMSKLATLFPFFQQLMLRRFAPRAGALLHDGDLATLNHELKSVRYYSSIAVFAQTGAILFCAPFVMPLFDIKLYDLSVLIMLSFTVIFYASYSGQNEILKMSGRAVQWFYLSASSAAIFVLTTVIISGYIEIYSVPAGMIVSLITTAPFLVENLSKHGIYTSNIHSLIISIFGAFLSCGGLIIAAVTDRSDIGSFVVGSSLLAFSAYLYSQRNNYTAL